MFTFDLGFFSYYSDRSVQMAYVRLPFGRTLFASLLRRSYKPVIPGVKPPSKRFRLSLLNTRREA